MMPQQKKLFTESFKIRSSEVHPDGKAKLQTICDLLQEVAGNHALELNFDVTQLHSRNLTWVLHRLDVQINRYPKWREEVTVKTWPSSGDKLRAYRDFVITDENGDILVKALSYWLMIDLDNRRTVRMPESVRNMAPKNIDHVVPLRSTRPTSPDSSEVVKTFSVRYSDLDVNRHVNNVKYVEWITETLPNSKRIKTFDIEFKAESKYGETVRIHCDRKDIVRAEVRNNENGKILATANIALF